MLRILSFVSSVVLCTTAVSGPAEDFDATLDVVTTTPSYAGCAGGEYLDSRYCHDYAFDGHTPTPDPLFAWVVLVGLQGGWHHVDGIGALQFGWTHTAPVEGWVTCSGGGSVPQTGWPESGTGIGVTWPGGCLSPPTQTVRVGYAPLARGDEGCIHLTGDPRFHPEPVYSDCAGAELMLYPELADGIADLATGAWSGVRCEPCSPEFPCVWTCGTTDVPVEHSTWGRVKAAFGR